MLMNPGLAPTEHWPRGCLGRTAPPAPTSRHGGCPPCGSSIGHCSGIGRRRRGMTAIDFSAFVDELATVSGETILPFFRTALSIEDKGRARQLRPGDRGRPRGRNGDARAHPPHLSGPRHHRRGIRRGARRRRICLGARPDRRHQVLHRRHAGLGHADRACCGRASRCSA